MIEVEVEDEGWSRAQPDVATLAHQAASAAAALGPSGAIAVLLTSDEAVRDLNRRFLGKDAATNVLSFPIGPHGGGGLGDVALALGVCAAEASAQRKPLADHLRHLVIHGVLHLLGYDHQRDDEATRMETIERELLARMRIPDPYAEPAARESQL